MYKIKDFIKWALTHVKISTVPANASLALPYSKCGTDPWQYLFGSVRVKTTQATIDRYFENHYKKQMTRAQYDKYTKDWDRNGYATDCEGLLDAYLTYECGESTDINADMNYRLWCTDKGKIGEIERSYVVGEALFMANSAGKMTHIGWVCGFDSEGRPLVVEARGIAYGVVITRLDGRNWTHRGLMAKKFDYTEDHIMIDFNQINPMPIGEVYKHMQEVLYACNITDYEDKPIEVDGKWGKRSKAAFDKFIEIYAPKSEPTQLSYTLTLSNEEQDLYNWKFYL